MDGDQEGITPGPFKYGFSFDIEKIRSPKLDESPSTKEQSFSIPVTFGDVVQQGRSPKLHKTFFLTELIKKGCWNRG